MVPKYDTQNHLWTQSITCEVVWFLDRFVCSKSRDSNLISLRMYILKSYLGVANTQVATTLGAESLGNYT